VDSHSLIPTYLQVIIIAGPRLEQRLWCVSKVLSEGEHLSDNSRLAALVSSRHSSTELLPPVSRDRGEAVMPGSVLSWCVVGCGGGWGGHTDTFAFNKSGIAL
jgi:hypothetical protein